MVWSSRVLMVGTVLAFLAASDTTHALPAPMSARELEEKSDVIATIRVLGVACTGYITDDKTKEKLPTYQAWVQVVKVKKGDVKPGETILIQWKDIPKGLLGPWKVEYLPGEEVQTHLRWSEKRQDYASVWWNAKGEPTRPAEVKKLPEKQGEAVIAKGLFEQTGK
jgi:hypothetical protein